MAPLIPCPECNRHLRPNETTCPFCNADVRDAVAHHRARVIPTERLGRTALMAFAAANMGVAACGGEVTGPSPGPGTGGFVAQPHYGAPPPPPNFGGTPSAGGASNTGGFNTGGVILAPPYGISPLPPDGTGGDVGAPEYGAPPPPPGSGGVAGAGGSRNTGADANTGGDMVIPIYGAAPPKPQE